VNITDFNLLATNFGKSGMAFSQGNLDRSSDGAVAITDFNLLASAFGKAMSPPEETASLAGNSRFSQVAVGTQTSQAKAISSDDPSDLLSDAGLL
jgi:hypothetical protein